MLSKCKLRYIYVMFNHHTHSYKMTGLLINGIIYAVILLSKQLKHILL
uniref:Uncharacterized protein n=1 Tax=Anguilla anguilla TaxID=7936 RepID=A0A0E9Q215_ANGAN